MGWEWDGNWLTGFGKLWRETVKNYKNTFKHVQNTQQANDSGASDWQVYQLWIFNPKTGAEIKALSLLVQVSYDVLTMFTSILWSCFQRSAQGH